MEKSSRIYDYFSSVFGIEAAEKFWEFIHTETAQYIRVNSLKTDPGKLSRHLSSEYGILTEPVSHVNNALKVTQGFELAGKTIEHIIGEYYMQGLSSMMPPLVLNPGPKDLVLDLCAAPGSKTTGLGEMMTNQGTLIANEIALDRVKILVYNLDRMNLINTGVMHLKGEWLSKIYDNYFDKILVDAPCSGLGILQKNKEVDGWWSEERVDALSELQFKLLTGAIKMCKVGGEIVYSTCTLTIEENEYLINKTLQKYPLELLEVNLTIKSNPALIKYKDLNFDPSLEKARRIFPWEADSDGFFIARLRKIDATLPNEPYQTIKSDLKIINYNKELKKITANLERDFGLSEDVLSRYRYLIKGSDIYLLSAEWNDNNLSQFERIGTRFGIIDRRGETTLHTQAAQVLSKYLEKNIYEIENMEDLKKYLEGGVIKKSTEVKKQCAVKFKDKILGTAVVTSEGIKSRFPRAKRTQGMHLDFDFER